MKRKQPTDSLKQRISLLGDRMDENFEDLSVELAEVWEKLSVTASDVRDIKDELEKVPIGALSALAPTENIAEVWRNASLAPDDQKKFEGLMEAWISNGILTKSNWSSVSAAVRARFIAEFFVRQ